MIYCGIDYSMNSPALCIEKNGENYYYNLLGIKKYQGKFSIENNHFTVDLLPKHDNEIIRYTHISKLFNDFITNITDEKVKVLIEGYAYGSNKGAVFNIAENTQTLKIRLTNSPNIELIHPSIPPKTIKKYATDNGNAGKELMVKNWLDKTGIDNIQTHIDKKLEDSPISDFADSFWIKEYCKEHYE